MDTTTPTALVIAMLLLAGAISTHAWVTWRIAASRKGHDLRSQLEAHSATIEGVLESDEGRQAIARMVVNEMALQALIVAVEGAAGQATDPQAAAFAEAKQHGLWGRTMEKGAAVLKPVAKAVFGKINDYVKAGFGISAA